MDYMDTVNFAYTNWLQAKRWDDEDGITIAPQGAAEISLEGDALPFLKIAVMRHYMAEHGNESLD